MNYRKEVKIEQVIKEYVKQYEQAYSDYDSTYNDCLKDMRKIDLEGITEKEVKKVIKPYQTLRNAMNPLER